MKNRGIRTKCSSTLDHLSEKSILYFVSLDNIGHKVKHIRPSKLIDTSPNLDLLSCPLITSWSLIWANYFLSSHHWLVSHLSELLYLHMSINYIINLQRQCQTHKILRGWAKIEFSKNANLVDKRTTQVTTQKMRKTYAHKCQSRLSVVMYVLL